MYAFHVIERGSEHIRRNRPCQDYATSCCTDDYAISIIADGHGSERYFRSDSGSRLAAVIAKLILRDFLIATKNMTQLPQGDWQKQVAASIISNWNDLIEQDKTNNPFTEEELSRLSDADRQQVESGKWQFAYGTTLLAIVRTKKCFFGLHIGDGKCVAIDAEGNRSQPIPWDDECFLNQTTSLCDSDAINRFRFVYMTDNLPVAAFVASDGVDDTYTSDERLYEFYSTLFKMLQDNRDTAIADLQAFLPGMSEQGSHDDISIAGIVNTTTKENNHGQFSNIIKRLIAKIS
jgi:serine/threonine protein phosphatase PrpC